MTGEVIFLDARRRNPVPDCNCAPDFICYPHRLIDLAARVEDTRADMEPFRFCDWGTFERLTSDVLDVLASITDDCLPGATPTTEAGR